MSEGPFVTPDGKSHPTRRVAQEHIATAKGYDLPDFRIELSDGTLIAQFGNRTDAEDAGNAIAEGSQGLNHRLVEVIHEWKMQ